MAPIRGQIISTFAAREILLILVAYGIDQRGRRRGSSSIHIARRLRTDLNLTGVLRLATGGRPANGRQYLNSNNRSSREPVSRGLSILAACNSKLERDRPACAASVA